MKQILKEKSRRKRITWKQIVAFVMLITMFFTQQGMLEVLAAESNPLEQKTVSESNISVIDTEVTEQNKDSEEESENEENEAEDEETENTEAEDTTTENDETIESEDSETGEIEESYSEVVVTGFEGYDGFQPLYEYEVEYGCLLEKLPLPQEITAYVLTDNIEENTQENVAEVIPVTWVCVDDSMGGSEYLPEHENRSAAYTFIASLEEGYVLQEGMNPAWDMPYVTVSYAAEKKEGTKETQETLSLDVIFPTDKYDSISNVLTLSAAATTQISTSVTGTTVSNPILKISVPEKMNITYYPDENNETLKPNLAGEDSVSMATESKVTTLTYRFKGNVASVGFNITATPGYQLKDGETYQIKVQYYDGENLLKEESTDFIVDNPSVKTGFYPDNNFNEVKEYALENQASLYDIPFNKKIESRENHYPYEKAKMTVLIPEGAIPGHGEGENFMALEEGVTWTASGGWKVTYLKNQNYTNQEESISGTSDVLVYEASEAFLQGKIREYFNNEVYLRFINPQEGELITSVTPKIEITADGKEVCVYDHQEKTTYRCYAIKFKEYNIGDYFYLWSDSRADILYGNRTSYSGFIWNKSEEVMRNVKVSYTFDEKIYVPNITLNLLNNNAIYPATAQVSYKTKKGGDTVFTKELTVDENKLSLSDDYITYIEVVYEKIGVMGNGISSVFTASLYNIEGLNETNGRYVKSKLLSATGDNYGVYEPQNATISNAFFLKNQASLSYMRELKNITTGVTSNVALNKGDTFAVTVKKRGNVSGYVKNLGIYVVMPKGYIFKGYTPPDACKNGDYTVASREIDGGKVIYSVKYTDDIDYPNSENHEFQFVVGPEVDTSEVQTKVKMPEGIYLSSEHEVYKLIGAKETGNIIDTDGDGKADTSLDINGDEDTEDSYYSCTISADTTINSVVALTTQSYLTSSRQSGEGVEQEYEFDSTGTYKFYIFNGLSSGQILKEAEIEIPIPQKGDTITWQETEHTSQWGVNLTGPVVTTGGFLEEAEIAYSIDGSSYSQTVNDYAQVKSIKITTTADKTLGSAESAVVQIPFKVVFGEDMTAGNTYQAYWDTKMKYQMAEGEEATATIQPSILTAAGKTLSGTVYKDYNGNGIQDENEKQNGKTYFWKLYQGEGIEGNVIDSGKTNSSSGLYSTSIPVPGTYTLKVEKDATEYYVSNNHFSTEGCYTFTVGENTSVTSWKNINLGILSPRTIKTNFTSVTLKNTGTPRTIVPTLTPALLEGEEAVSFSSSDPSIVTVSDSGRLTLVGKGNAEVTVKAPQLQALVSQGAEQYITQKITVRCQVEECHKQSAPVIKTTSSTSAADIGEVSHLQLSYGDGEKTGYFYYYYQEEGSCNVTDHENTNDVTAEIISKGETEAELAVVASMTTYKRFQLTASKPGIVKIRFKRVWGHGKESKPEDRVITVYVLPYTIPKPQITVSPAKADGDNGWYKTLPEISVVTNADEAYMDTMISVNGGTYEVLDNSNQPHITESGVYSFVLYNKVRPESISVQSSTVTLNNVKVDREAPVVTGIRVDDSHVTVLLQDEVSGINKLDYKISDQDAQSVDVENGQAVIELPTSAEDTLIFCPADIAGNAGSVRSIKNIAGFWILENDVPFLHQEGEGIEENELKASVLIIDTGSGIKRDKITLTQNGETLSADSYIIEAIENGYRVIVNSQGVTTANPILLKVVDNLGQESSMEVVSKSSVYTISYDGGEGAQGQTPETTKVVDGQEYVLASNPYTKEGWTFCGWYFRNKLYQPGQKIVIGAESMVFRALWEKSETKSADVLAVEAAIRYLPEPDATDEVILNAEKDICDTKDRYEALEDGEQEQVDSSLKEKLAKLLARLMTIETIIDAEVIVEASNLNEIAQLLNLTEDVTDENLNTPHEEVKVTITMKLDKIEENHVIEGKEDIAGSNQGKEMEFFDISILKEITKKVNGTSTTESGKINQLPKELEISIELSEEAKKGSNHKVFRYHEGDVEQLVSKREGNNLIFYTDKFSTYAVVYEPYIVSKDSDSTSENKQDSWNESGQGYENENNGGIIAALVKSKANKDRGALDQVPKTGQNYRNSFMSVKVECIIRKKEWDADREDVEE